MNAPLTYILRIVGIEFSFALMVVLVWYWQAKLSDNKPMDKNFVHMLLPKSASMKR